MFSANAHLFNFAYILSRSKLATQGYWIGGVIKKEKPKCVERKKAGCLCFVLWRQDGFAFLSHTVGPIILGRCLSLKRVTSRWDIFLDPASA